MQRMLTRPKMPLTHEALDSMTPWHSVAYVRDLLAWPESIGRPTHGVSSRTVSASASTANASEGRAAMAARASGSMSSE